MNQIPAALGLTAQQVEGLLVAAGRAPSLHNSQPWQFVVTPRAIELHADPARTLSIADPDGREQRLACGAALFNLRLALHGHGIRPTVTLLPDRDRPELLAVIRHGGAKEPTPEQTRLLRAVALWRTNRRPFSAEAVGSPEQHALRRAALDEGAWLHVVHDREQRAALHTLMLRAHHLQTANPAFRDELAAWTPEPTEQRDGVSAEAGGPTPEPYDTWVMRDFTGATGRPRVPGKHFEEEPLIAVLTSHLSGTTAEVQVGQALQRVLLTATAQRTCHVVSVAGRRGAADPRGVAPPGRRDPAAAGCAAHRVRLARGHITTARVRGSAGPRSRQTDITRMQGEAREARPTGSSVPPRPVLVIVSIVPTDRPVTARTGKPLMILLDRAVLSALRTLLLTRARAPRTHHWGPTRDDNKAAQPPHSPSGPGAPDARGTRPGATDASRVSWSGSATESPPAPNRQLNSAGDRRRRGA